MQGRSRGEEQRQSKSRGGPSRGLGWGCGWEAQAGGGGLQGRGCMEGLRKGKARGQGTELKGKGPFSPNTRSSLEEKRRNEAGEATARTSLSRPASGPQRGRSRGLPPTHAASQLNQDPPVKSLTSLSAGCEPGPTASGIIPRDRGSGCPPPAPLRTCKNEEGRRALCGRSYSR